MYLRKNVRLFAMLPHFEEEVCNNTSKQLPTRTNRTMAAYNSDPVIGGLLQKSFYPIKNVSILLLLWLLLFQASRIHYHPAKLLHVSSFAFVFCGTRNCWHITIPSDEKGSNSEIKGPLGGFAIFRIKYYYVTRCNPNWPNVYALFCIIQNKIIIG